MAGPAKLDILGWWTFFSKIPLIGNMLFNLVVSMGSPYTGSIPLAFKSLSKGKCIGVMRERRSIRNPFNSVHAAAMINMGEAVGAMAVMSWIESQPKPMRAIPYKLSGDFKKKARGTLSATADLSEDMMLKSVSEGTAEVVTVIRDSSGDVVSEVTALWKISAIDTTKKVKST
ncbi:hypothetical protein HDU67_009207 [Dinochytrium kinnereticum]|nr:hypothetical protein HDU67_009207 [Dinochytrium kinnereticum]